MIAKPTSPLIGLFRPITSFSDIVHHLFFPTTASKGNPPYYGIPKTGLHPRDAEDWFEAIEGGIRSPHDLENVTIIKVKWLKENHGLGHEYLVFTIDVEDPQYEAFLAIERSTTQEIVENALEGDNFLQIFPENTLASMTDSEKRNITNALCSKLKDELKQIKLRANRHASTSNSLAMSSRIVNSDSLRLAKDLITRVDHKDGSEPTERSLRAKCLDTLTFGTRKFRLRDLGIMVREIHASHKEYTLTKYNSYWFARTLVAVIETLMDPTSATPKRVEENAGCVPGIPTKIVQSDPIEVTRLVEQIENAIREDDQRIAQLKANTYSDEILRETLARERQESADREAASRALLQEVDAEIKRLQAQLALK